MKLGTKLALGGGIGLAALIVLWPSDAKATPRDVDFDAKRYVPGSDEQIALFTNAAEVAGVPVSWGSDPNMVELLRRESNGWVGIPNYQYKIPRKEKHRWPEVWADLRAGNEPSHSSATGLGQLQHFNVDKFYPDGRDGIGDPLNEAVGMLRYVEKRYGSPSEAIAFHDRKGWY